MEIKAEKNSADLVFTEDKIELARPRLRRLFVRIHFHFDFHLLRWCKRTNDSHQIYWTVTCARNCGYYIFGRMRATIKLVTTAISCCDLCEMMLRLRPALNG